MATMFSFLMILLIIMIISTVHTVLLQVKSAVESAITEDFKECVGMIISTQLPMGSQIMASKKSDRYLSHIHKLNHVTTVYRTDLNNSYRNLHHNYLIVISENKELISTIEIIKKDLFWNPRANFIIVIECTNPKNKLNDVFKTLFQNYIFEVLVVTREDAAQVIYTYLPYHKYECGNYENVKRVNDCKGLTVGRNIFPVPESRSSKNCIFRVITHHFPPFVFLPGKDRKVGLENDVINLLAEMEQFDFVYEYDQMFERFGDINNNNQATDLLGVLQNGSANIALGGFANMGNRNLLFDYIWTYFTFTDDYLMIFSSRGDNLPRWAIFVHAFRNKTRIVLFVVTLTVCFLLIVIEKAFSYLKSTTFASVSSIFYYMLFTICGNTGNLLQRRFKFKMCLLIWAWFVFFVNTFYQSSLSSYTTFRGKIIDVKDVDTLVRKNYKPCIPNPVLGYMKDSKVSFFNHLEHLPPECESTESSLLYLTENKGFYTVNVLYKYLYVINHTNRCKIHMMRVAPLQRMERAIFVNKGFPFLAQFNYQVLKLSESGLFIKSFRDMIEKRSILLQKRACLRKGKGPFKIENVYHVYLFYVIGVCISIFVFIIELIK
ncbi:uncharacterized protein LOC128669202 [Plodia interpunctella]|uniref:uncharacterized protein LOC128669202 n=1 Tax=Plodia interpunctella TaxID=58824 RepID=UPI00236886A0|nr:uncharacterized protein LOC128669202 [Plodia interpunctella]